MYLKGRNPSTNLYPSWIGGGERVNIGIGECKEKIESHQDKYKTRYDFKYCTKKQRWAVGELDFVKRPDRNSGYGSKYYKPMWVIEIKHRGTDSQR